MNSQQLLPQTETEQEEELRRERRAARMFRRNQRSKARIYLWSVVGGSALLLGLMGFIFLQIQSIIAINTAYPITNGVSCDRGEQLAYHIHVHLTIYINGKLYPLPKGVGIAADGSCIYWMHTHKNDGIIHIEAPENHNLSLDDFLNIWYKDFPKLGPPAELNQIGWKIYINGKLRTDLVAAPLHIELPLTSHNIVTMEYGTPNPRPDTIYVFPPNLPK
jgi:hypothetical protein